MFFSVIVPVYNVAPYLRQCLDSLVDQTCRDMEIIAVDDGSTDGSGEILDEYASRYDFFTAIHQDNQGLSSARNTGMEHAKGEWITFIDSDDWIEPDYLELIEGHIFASNADLYRISFETVDDSGEKMNEYLLGKDDMVFSFTDEKMRFRYYFRYFTNTVRVWGNAYRRSIIDEHDLRFVDTKKIYAEDMLFNFEYMLYAKKAVYLHDILYHYRKRSGSLMDVTGTEMRLTRVGVLCDMAYQYVCSQNLPLFKEYFYFLYFKFINRFILRDAKKFTDAELRRILDKMAKSRCYRDCIVKIRENDNILRQYTRGRVWYRKDFGKSKIFDRKKTNERLAVLAKRHPFLWKIIFLNDDLYYIRKGTHAFPPSFLRVNEEKVAYLSMPKAACSSINVSMLKREDIPDDYSVWEIRRPYIYKEPVTEEGWFTFTFVRDPFARLVSCYENKYHTDRTHNRMAIERGYQDFDRYFYGYMKEDKGFEHFIDQVLALPWRLDNKHFASQYKRITDKDGKLLVDYIGKVEHLEEDYEPIRVKYGFAPLKVYNKSEHGDWRDYYTTKLAKKIYKKYKKDVQYFGYEDSYRDLLEYCKAKGK